jgi:hypothetical protein
VSFAEPIALGLRVEPMRMLARLGRWLGRTELVTGDAGFDSACRARADDAERAKSVLTPELRAALASVPWADWTFDDAGFVAQARATAPVESAESLAAMLRHAATIAAVVERVCAPTGRP